MMGKLVGGTGLNDSMGVIRRGAGAETDAAAAVVVLAAGVLLACALPVDARLLRGRAAWRPAAALLHLAPLRPDEREFPV